MSIRKRGRYGYLPFLYMREGTVFICPICGISKRVDGVPKMTIQIGTETYLSTDELAARCGVTRHTVHLWRANRRAPQAVTARGRTWYALSAVTAWEAARAAAKTPSGCRIEACARPATAARDDLCVGHARMVRAGHSDLHGTPPPQPPPKTLAARRDAQTVRDNDRPPRWAGRVSGDGYAKVCRKGRTQYLHRLVWEDAHGTIDDPDLTVDHTCRTRHCVELEHLQLVSRADNIRAGFEARLAEQEAYSQGTLMLEPDLEGRLVAAYREQQAAA